MARGDAVHLAARFGAAFMGLVAATSPTALAGEPASGPATASESRVVPTELCRNFFFVPVTLADREGYPQDRTLWFIYDTGNEATVVDPDSLERVSNRDFDRGDRVNLVEATAGPVTWNRLPTRLRELDHLAMALGRPVDGILHFDAFGDYLVTLDYAAGEIRLDEGRLPRPDGAMVFSTDGPDERPWLDVTFGNNDRRLLVDNGAGGTVLKIHRLDRVDTLSPPVPAGAALKIDRVERSDAARAAGKVRFASFELDQPILESTRGTQLLGGEVMRHFTWTFDGVTDRVRITPLAPGSPIGFPPLDHHGLVLVPGDDGLRVHEIVAKSAAEGSGIRAGDVITRIGGRDLLDRDCVTDLPDEALFTVQRDGASLDIVVPLTRFVE